DAVAREAAADDEVHDERRDPGEQEGGADDEEGHTHGAPPPFARMHTRGPAVMVRMAYSVTTTFSPRRSAQKRASSAFENSSQPRNGPPVRVRVSHARETPLRICSASCQTLANSSIWARVK